jgi:hypothetical protein
MIVPDAVVAQKDNNRASIERVGIGLVEKLDTP